MKKRLSLLLIALGILTLLFAAIIVSCTSNTGSGKGETATDSNIVTETETLNESTHLQGSETSKKEESSKVETTTAKSEATTNTSEITTEVSSETESDTEIETSVPSTSLSFVSNNNGTCTLTGIGNVTDSYISIPSRSPNGDIVIAIAEKAFYSNDTIKAVEIPSTVMSIGNMAFSNCRSLLYIAVDSENTMFKDINGVLFSKDLSTLICYPSGSGMSSFDMPIDVKTICDMAFYNCNGLKTVVYPGTVEEWSNIAVGQQNYGLISASVSCK